MLRGDRATAPIVAMRTAPHAGDVLDLTEIRTACSAVIEWFDARAAGCDAPFEELDYAVARAKSLPYLPGAFGQALAAIATGGRDCNRNHIIEALSHLRRPTRTLPPSPGSDPNRPPTALTSVARRRGSRRRTTGQLLFTPSECCCNSQ
jgi:hypothetical protein